MMHSTVALSASRVVVHMSSVIYPSTKSQGDRVIHEDVTGVYLAQGAAGHYARGCG